MRRITINALADIGCPVTFIPSLIAGRVLFFSLSSGGGRGGSRVIWVGITRYDRVLWHDIAGFAFAALLIVHRLLHGMYFSNIEVTHTVRKSSRCI